MADKGTFSKGLEDIIAAESSICSIDGKESKLYYRGYAIHDLVTKSTFEETTYLLLHGELPTRQQLSAFLDQLATGRELPAEFISAFERIPKKTHPMAALRTGVSLLASFDPEADDKAPEANYRKAIRLLAKIPSIVAGFERMRKGQKPVAPKTDASFSTAANFLYMMKGKEATKLEARMLDQYYILLAEHDTNASTFAARITASTLSDFYSAMVSAVGTLKGDLHGSANSRAMESLIQIGEPKNVDSFVEKALAEKRKLMGFGHRVYKGADPRAFDLKDMAKSLAGENAEQAKWYAISEKLEKAVWDRKKLYPNVDFYSASVLYSIGIPIDQFTAMFAISRLAGWSAHVLEQYTDNRLIRPVTHYVGKSPRNYTPIEKRQ